MPNYTRLVGQLCISVARRSPSRCQLQLRRGGQSQADDFEPGADSWRVARSWSSYSFLCGNARLEYTLVVSNGDVHLKGCPTLGF
jgi:hypothetical protein